ncbi:MAG: DUF3443 family protein [Burkholderiales bacterium]|nr:DUF3443 family protein [Burkholderiales bacterium]
MKKTKSIIKLLSLSTLGMSIFTACSSGTTTSNPPVQIPISIGAGLNGDGINTMYVSITLCTNSAGTNCQTIDNIILDTGSFGLKINKSALPESFVLQMPRVTTTDDQMVYACNTFGSGYVFAEEHYGILKLANTMTNNVIVQIIENSPSAEIPDDCIAKGPFDDFANFGANGIIGVNPAIGLDNSSILLYKKDINGNYVALSSGESAIVPMLNKNPLPNLSSNNNGFVISIPPVTQNTNTNVSGTMILGVNTSSMNQVTNKTNLVVASESDLSSVCNSACFYSKINNPESTIPAVFDSGTNSWVFMNDELQSSACSYGYCPESPFTWVSSVYSYDFAANESYVITGVITKDETNPSGDTVSFSVMPGWGYYNYNNETLYGSPFFFGKNVYVIFPSNKNKNPIWGFESY